MSVNAQNRRGFLKQSAAIAAGTLPYWFSPASAYSSNLHSASERPTVGSIGNGFRWRQLLPQITQFADCVAVCDVDAERAGSAYSLVKSQQHERGKVGPVAVYDDYRRILDRDDIDLVTIVTPDHWHTKLAIEAMQAGKDVYCEKPLTLTIDEGKQIIKVLDETKRVFQVGTQQRSEMGLKFLKAVALVRHGRIGEVKRVTCVINGAPLGGRFSKTDPPPHLNWDKWLGPAPSVEYIEKRCHYQFRWWYEYSGGKMTDWGAHHVDISQWAIGMDQDGPTTVEGNAVHPCPLVNGYPVMDDIYNCAYKFRVTCQFPNGVELVITDHDPSIELGNGILFEGTEGRFIVTRRKLVGKPVEELGSNPLPEDALVQLCKGKEPGDHVGNFIECVKDRELPISDVYTHHRALTTCHLANIAIRLGRKLDWNAARQTIDNDSEAAQWLSRESRRPYDVNV